MTTARLTLICFLIPLASPARADESAVTFEGSVRSILNKHCVSCHKGEQPRGELDLTNYGSLMAGGVSGKAVVANKPEQSLLYTLTAHLEDPKMPPNKPKIPQRELDALRKWIDGGLVEKSGIAAAATPTPSKPEHRGGLVPAETLARATPVTALAISPTAPLVAVPGKKQVLIYELPAAKLMGAVPFSEGEVHTLRFSRDGTVLIAGGGVGGQSGAVVGFEVGTWKRLFALADDTDAVLAADISTDRTRVVFGGPGRVVKILSVPDGKILHTFRKPTDWVLSVGFSPEGLLVAAGDRFGGLFVWEVSSGKEFLTLRGHSKAVTGLAWRADSNVLASCSEDCSVRLWNMHTGQEAAKWAAHSEGVQDIAFHQTGKIATAGRDAHVKLWGEDGKPIAKFDPAGDEVLRIALTPDAKALVAGDLSGDVRVWPTTGGPATKLALPVNATPIAVSVVPVPTPAALPEKVSPTPTRLAVSQSDLDRKRAALKAVEEAAEKLKEEAARNPKNAALAKAYLQLCEAALAMKAEVLEAEAATIANSEGNK